MPFELNENYVLPPLTSKRAVLDVIHELTQAGIRGALAPRTLTSVLYALQVALSVHNSNLPERPPAALTTAALPPPPPTIEGGTTDAKKKNPPQATRSRKANQK